MRLDPGWRSRAVSIDSALSLIKSNMRVFVQGAAATPLTLLDGLCRRTDVEAVRLYHLHLEGPCEFAELRHAQRYFSVSLFTGPALRTPIAEGRADFLPIFLSDIPRLFTSRKIPLDAAIVQLSPPDRHGHCTLGTSVDAARSAVDSATMVIAEINERMPRTHGNSSFPLDRVTAFVCTDRPLPEHTVAVETDVEARIGEIIADLVEDGATLQLGIGGIPDAVLARLKNKHDLGIHTEMFSDRAVDLIEGGVVTNRSRKCTRAAPRRASSPDRAAFSTSSMTTSRSNSTAATARTTPPSSARTRRSSPSTRRSRSTSPDRSAPTRWAIGFTPASADKWTSSTAPPSRRVESRSSPCPR